MRPRVAFLAATAHVAPAESKSGHRSGRSEDARRMALSYFYVNSNQMVPIPLGLWLLSLPTLL